MPRPSVSITRTLEPCIVKMQEMLRNVQPPPLSLAQGIVYWSPPDLAQTTALEAMRSPDVHGYGATYGLPELVDLLEAKLERDNHISTSDAGVMVTSGANQAYMNIVLSLLDPTDQAVLFAPYYFNHAMALQMVIGDENLVVGKSDADLSPDLGWLRDTLAQRPRIRMITITNPGNPTGVTLPPSFLEEVAAITEEHGIWLVVDNTYEHFAGGWYGGPDHSTVSGPHVVNIFSFSKSFGMMGWRVGYLVAPRVILPEVQKVQDTVAICPSVLSQHVAVGALRAGTPWVQQNIDTLQGNYQQVREAIASTLGEASIGGGTGALYLFVRLPPTADEEVSDDSRVVEWLARDFGVCVIPGSACGSPGFLRICFANLSPTSCGEASERLSRGLAELARRAAAVPPPSSSPGALQSR